MKFGSFFLVSIASFLIGCAADNYFSFKKIDTYLPANVKLDALAKGPNGGLVSIYALSRQDVLDTLISLSKAGPLMVSFPVEQSVSLCGKTVYYATFQVVAYNEDLVPRSGPPEGYELRLPDGTGWFICNIPGTF